MVKLFLQSVCSDSINIDTMSVGSERQASQQQLNLYNLSMRGITVWMHLLACATLLVKALILASMYGSAVVLQCLRLHCLCTPLMCSTVYFTVY